MTGRTLYLLDEPTTGLHLADTARLQTFRASLAKMDRANALDLILDDLEERVEMLSDAKAQLERCATGATEVSKEKTLEKVRFDDGGKKETPKSLAQSCQKRAKALKGQIAKLEKQVEDLNKQIEQKERELRSLALCVVVAVALLRIGASATLDSLGTAVIGLFIGGIALGSAIRRGGGARGWAVGIGGVVGAVSGALDGAIAGVAACAGLPDVHAFTGRPLACDGTPGVMLTGALLLLHAEGDERIPWTSSQASHGRSRRRWWSPRPSGSEDTAAPSSSPPCDELSGSPDESGVVALLPPAATRLAGRAARQGPTSDRLSSQWFAEVWSPWSRWAALPASPRRLSR